MESPVFFHFSSNKFNSAISQYALNAHLSLSKNDPSHLYLKKNSLPSESCRKQSIRNFFSINFHSVFSPLTILGLCLKHRPQTIICYGGTEAVYTLLAKIFLPKTKIWRFKGNAIRQYNRVQKWLSWLSEVHLSGYVVPSLTQRKTLSEITRKPVFVVPLGCNQSKFSFISTQTKKEILIVGRIDPVKGYDQAAEQFARFRENNPNLKLKLRIIGEFQNISKEQFHGFFQRFGLKENADYVHHPGRVERVEEYMNQALFGWVCSRGSELICRVGHELLLCGAPVLVSNVGSLPDLVEDESLGLVYSHEGEGNPLEWMYQKFSSESIASRRERAEKSAKKFSLPTMAKGLRYLS